MTVLGWLWPLARQLVQLAVLVFIFSHVLDLGIHDFPVFVFCGLIAWNWFSIGLGAATSSLLDRRHLVYQPRVPPSVLPLVAITVPLVDMVMALPVLLLMLSFGEGLRWTMLLVPLLLVVQFVLMSGIVWLTSAAAVFFRDVPNVVGVFLTVLFYATPVFYAVSKIPERYSPLLHANPMTALVERSSGDMPCKALTMISGPTPEGSPMVMPIVGWEEDMKSLGEDRVGIIAFNE